MATKKKTMDPFSAAISKAANDILGAKEAEKRLEQSYNRVKSESDSYSKNYKGTWGSPNGGSTKGLREASTLSKLISTNKAIDQSRSESMQMALEKMKNRYQQYGQQDRIFNQFKTGDEYNRYQMGWNQTSAPNANSPENVEKRKAYYEQLKARADELNQQSFFAKNISERNTILKERDQIRSELNLYDYGQGVTDRYDSMRGNADYKANSLRGDMYDEDKLGFFLDNNDRYGSISNAMQISPEFVAGYSAEEQMLASKLNEGTNARWDKLRQDEIDNYYYLINTQGKDAAYQYLKDMEPTLGKRVFYGDDETPGTDQMGESEKAYREASALGKLMLNMATIPENVMASAGGAIEDFGHILHGEQINPYSKAHTYQYDASMVRSLTSEAIDDVTGGKKLPLVNFGLGDVYQSLMSGADSVFGGLTLNKAYTPFMGMSAASSKMRELYEKGASKEQIVAGGLLSGIAEAAFEYISLDKMISSAESTKSMTELVKNFFVQAGVEGTEELCTEIANTFIDALNMGGLSDWESWKGNEGAAKDKFFRALGQAAANTASAFLGGAISGGPMGLAGSATGLVNYNQEMTQRGELIQKQGSEAPYINKAQSESASDQTRNLLDQYQNGKGKKAKGKGSANTLGKLVESIEAPVNSDATRNLIRESLADKYGEDVDEAYVDKVQKHFENNAEVQLGDRKAIADAKELKSSRVFQAINEHAQREARASFYANTESKAKMSNEELLKKAEAKVADSKSASDNVVRIESIGETGEAVLAVKGGGTVSYNDAMFDSTAKSAVYTKVLDMGMTVQSANAVAQSLLASTENLNQKILGMEMLYNYGKAGYPFSMMDKSSFVGNMTDSEQKFYYYAGRADAGTTFTNDQKAIAAKAKEDTALRGKTGKVLLSESAKALNLSDRQKAAHETMGMVASQITHSNIVFYASVKGTVNGKETQVFSHPIAGFNAGDAAPNGFYKRGNGTIYLDMNAGNNGEQAVLYTAAHELTHFIREWSPEKFKVLSDFVVQNYAKEVGGDIEAIIQRQIDIAARSGENISRDVALEEAIADFMQPMFTDADLATKLANLKNQDKSLWEKVKEFITNLKNMITSAYKDLDPYSFEGQEMLKMKNKIDEIADLFAEALVDAGDTYEKMGISVDSATESASPEMFSLRTWEASDYVTDMDEAAKELAKAIGVSVKKAKAYIDDVNSISYMIANDKGLDYTETGLSPFVSNAEYGGSFDYTTLCKKRRLFTGTYSAIQEALEGLVLSPMDMLDIRDRMDKAGLEVSCGKCYVEGSRANMSKFSKKFMELYEKYYPDSYQPKLSELDTPDGIEKIRQNHPEVYEQYEYFWNHYGRLREGDPNLFASQQKPKLYQMRSAYNGEILKNFKGDTKVAEKNKNGGIRMQSFSDFEIVHLIDAMQTIMDMSRVGLNGQAYTKVPDFAWALGNTGLKINLSIDAWSVGEDGKLVFNNKEGMPFETAMELRNAYSKNVGTICCVYDDAQFMAAMADDRIDFIIPFHRSQWKKSQYKAMGLPATTKDYTYQQNEKWLDPSKHTHEYRGRQVKDKCTNYMPNEYWDFSKSGKENAEAYLAMCARDGKRPKFYKFLDKNADGSFSLKADGSTDGYWKLLIDFKMYDNNGVGSPQLPVTPNFNMEECTRMMKEYEGGHENFPVAQGIVDEFVKDYKAKHKDSDVRKSARVRYVDGSEDVVNHPGDVDDGTVLEYLKLAKKRKLLDNTYIPLGRYTPQIIVDSLNNAGYNVKKRPLIMSAYKARYTMSSSVGAGKKQNNKGHGYSAEKVLAALKSIDHPYAIVAEGDNRYAAFATIDFDGKNGTVILECGANIEDNLLKDEYDKEFDVVVTMFDPNETRNGLPYDYLEYLLGEGCREIDIIEKGNESDSFNGGTPAREKDTLPLYNKDITPADKMQPKNEQAIRKSARDSEGRELTNGQQEYFKDSKIRDNNGNLLRVYHGTPSGGFTVFDPNASYLVDKPSVASWFTTDIDMVNKYYAVDNSMYKGGKSVYEVYLNAKNPLVVDANGGPWNQIEVDEEIWKGYGKTYRDFWTDKRLPLKKLSTEDIAKYAKKNGYDGIIIKNVRDGSVNDNPKDVYAVFDSNQIKNVTNENPTSDPDIRYSARETKESADFTDKVLFGTQYSSGGVMETGLTYKMLKQQFAVEWDDKVAAVHEANHDARVFAGEREGNALTFDMKKYAKGLLYAHFSPVCHNFSIAKHNAQESPMDRASAKKVAKDIRDTMLPMYTVENAPAYATSKSAKIIEDTLTELGYKIRPMIYNAADYGAATSRDRYILVAVRGDLELPEVPVKQPRTNSWDKVTRNMWDSLPKAKARNGHALADYYLDAMRNTKKLQQYFNPDGTMTVDKPLLIITTTSGHEVTFAEYGKLCPTLTTNCGEARLILPGENIDLSKPSDNVRKVTPEFMGAITGIPEGYDYGKSAERAFTIIGNGIPPQMVKAVIGGALESVYRQTHDGAVLKSNRAGESYDSRTLLANALMTSAQNDEERANLETYKSYIDRLNKFQGDLDEKRKAVSDWMNNGQPHDAEWRKNLELLRDDADKLANKVNWYDRQLLSLQAMEPMQNLLKREKEAVRRREYKKGTERVKQAMERSKTRTEKTEMRGKIKRLINDFNSRDFKAKQGKYIPKELMKPVNTILGMIDIDSKRAGGEKLSAHLADLKVQYAAIANNPKYNLSYDPQIDDMIQKLAESIGDTDIYHMTPEQLQMTYNTLRGMMHTVREATKVHNFGTALDSEKSVYEVSDEMRREIDEDAKGKNGTIQKYIRMQMRPETMFQALAGFKKDSYWGKAYQMLEQGQLKMFDFERRANDLFKDILKNHKYIESISDPKKLVDVGLLDKAKKPIKITKGMALSLYMHLLNEDNARHFANGGLTVPDMQRYYKRDADAYGTGRTVLHGVSTEGLELRNQYRDALERLSEAKADGANDDVWVIQKEIDELKPQIDAITEKGMKYAEDIRKNIEKMLTKEDLKFIATAREFFDVMSKEELNKTTMELYGFEKANVEGYFPIHTDPNFRSATFDSITRDFNLENSGFMKDRVQASNPILLEDFSEVINSQIKNVARYTGMTLAVKDFNKLYSKSQQGYASSIQDSIAKKLGTSAQKYIENLMADIVGSRQTESTFLDRARGNLAGATLTLNVRVALSQSASFPTAAAEIGYKPLMRALGMGLKPADRQLIAKYSPLLYQRMRSGTTDEMANIRGAAQTQNRIAKKIQFLTGWISSMDAATVGRLWYASQFYVDENSRNLKKGTDEYYREVAKVFNRVVERTQPNYTTLQRPDILRSPNALLKQLTMFMTQRLQNANIVYESGARYMKYRDDLLHRRNGVTKTDLNNARTDLVRAVSSQVTATAMLVGLKFLADVLMHSMNGYRDDDKELTASSIILALFDNGLSSMISDVVGGSEAYSTIKSIVTGDKYYGISVGGFDTYKDAIENFVAVGQAMNPTDGNGIDRKKLASASKKLGYSVATLFGVPAQNGVKILNAVKYHYEDAINGEFGSFEAGVGRTATQDEHVVYEALMSKDRAAVDRLKKKYGYKFGTEARKALKSQDPRITEAAVARNSGDLQKYLTIARAIKKEGVFSQDDIVSAINSVIYDLNKGMDKAEKEQKHQGLFKTSDLKDAISAGKYSMLGTITDDIANTKVLNGANKEEAENSARSALKSAIVSAARDESISVTKAASLLTEMLGYSKEDADKALKSAFKTEIRENYADGEISESDAKRMLVNMGGMDTDEAASRVNYWKFQRNNPEFADVSESAVTKYYADSALNKSVGVQPFFTFYKATYNMTGVDRDGDGKADAYTKMDKIITYIARMNLSSSQKDMLLRFYYPAKYQKYYSRCPWH